MDEVEYEVINDYYILVKSTNKHLDLKEACNLLNAYDKYHKVSAKIVGKIIK